MIYIKAKKNLVNIKKKKGTIQLALGLQHQKNIDITVIIETKEIRKRT